MDAFSLFSCFDGFILRVPLSEEKARNNICGGGLELRRVRAIVLIVFTIVFYGAAGSAWADPAAQTTKPVAQANNQADQAATPANAPAGTAGHEKAATTAKPALSDLMRNMQASQNEQRNDREKRKDESSDKQRQTVPNGSLSLKDILDLKQKSMTYKQAITSPSARNPGQNRILPYIPAPQKVWTAVGYGTVIEVPFVIRKTNGVVIGDATSFKVAVLAGNQVAVFPLQAFQSSNVLIFSDNDADRPVLLYLREAYARGTADYFVQIERGTAQKITIPNLISLATGGTLGSAVNDALRSPVLMPAKKTDKKMGIRAEYQLSNPDYRVLVLNGQMECLKGCDLWMDDPNLDLTIVGTFANTGTVSVCQKSYSQFARRECREINP